MRPLHWYRSPHLTAAVAAAMLAVLTLAPRSAGAQPSETSVNDGRNHFAAAVGLFREGDYRGALVEFRRAYELSHNPRILYNIAQAEYELQDYAAALRSFDKYLTEGGSDVDPERRIAVKAEIKRLNGRVAKLDVRSNIVGADVLVDDVVVGHTPLPEPLVVSAGRRRIAVQKTGYPTAAQVIELAGGDASSLVLDLAPRSAARPPASTPPPPPAPSHAPFWFALAATGGLTAGAVVTGVFALGAHDDAENALRTRGISARDVESAHSKASNLALVTDILGGAAIAMGVVTVVLLVGTKDGTEAPASASLSAGPRGAFLKGTF